MQEGRGQIHPMADVVAAESSGNGKYGNAVTLRVSHQSGCAALPQRQMQEPPENSTAREVSVLKLRSPG